MQKFKVDIVKLFQFYVFFSTIQEANFPNNNAENYSLNYIRKGQILDPEGDREKLTALVINESIDCHCVLHPRCITSLILHFYFTFFRYELLVFQFVLLFVIITGNVIVILSLGCIRRRKSRMNFFILHLAVAGECQKFVKC